MPRPTAHARRFAACLLSVAVLTASGCGGSAPVNTPADRPSTSNPRSASVPLLIGGKAVGWTELTPYLAELGGAAAIEELILDREIERRLTDRALTLTAEMTQRERLLFDSGAGNSAEAIASIRRTRGLGPERFEALLRRNAGLRLLVGEPAAQSQTELRHAYELRNGPRRVLRVMIVPDAGRAGQIRQNLASITDASELEWAFAATAFEQSVDPSAAAGGYLGAVHPLDPSLPTAVREAVLATPDGKLSTLVLTEAGAVLVLPTRTTEATGVSFDEAAAGLSEELTRQKQRLAMDELARSILAESRPTVLDPSLNWAWENARRGR